MVKPETGQANFSREDDAAGGGRSPLLRLVGALRRPSRRPGTAVGEVEIGQAVGELERGLEAVGEARLDAVADDDAVDHDLDVVLVLLVERGGVLDRRRTRRRCGRG